MAELGFRCGGATEGNPEPSVSLEMGAAWALDHILVGP